MSPAGGIEQVLNRPLSGAEVRQIIVAKIERMLAGDSRLADFIAFPAFRFHADIGIVLQGAVHEEISRELDGGQGDMVPNAEDEQTIVSHTSQTEMPPNEARVDAGIGVPVLTRDERGREVEKLAHYDKSHIERVRGPAEHPEE
jgi:hypothetical protein